MPASPRLSKGTARRPEKRKNPFRALVRSIIHQQASGAAAETIHARFLALFSKGNSPYSRNGVRDACRKMRGAGLSSQKASYIKDLAEDPPTGRYGTVRSAAWRATTSSSISRR